MRILFVALFCLFSFSASAAPCAALPSLITLPCSIVVDGNYQLAGNIDGTSLGSAPIFTVGPGVVSATFECNGYAIESNNVPYVSASAAITGNSVANLTIRNCRFRGHGLENCVKIDNSALRAYRNITLESNTCEATAIGFDINSDGLVMRYNYLVNIGGSYNCYSGARTHALHLIGADAVIEYNKIRRVWNRCFNEAVGVSLNDLVLNTVIRYNEIENDIWVPGRQFAIWLGSAGSFIIIGNKITTWSEGASGHDPIAPSSFTGTSLIVNTLLPLGPTVSGSMWTILP